jgi:hypothetical protein
VISKIENMKIGRILGREMFYELPLALANGKEYSRANGL